MMKKESELIYLPSDVVLFDASDTAMVRDFVTTTKPTNVLLLGQESTSHYKILYNGDEWYVRKIDAVRGG